MPIVQTETEDGNEVELEVGPDEIQLTDDDDPTDLPGVQDEIDRVAGKTRKQARKSAKKKLKDDDEFWAEMAERRGVDLREDDLMPKGASKGEVKELKKELAQAKKKAEKADELEGELEQMRDTRLENNLLQHTDDVKDDLEDVFLGLAKDRFTYDEDDDDFYPVDEDGNPQFTRSTEDVVQDILENRPSLARDKSASSGPSDEPTSSTSSGDKIWTEEEHANADVTQMDDETYRDWATAAEEDRIKS